MGVPRLFKWICDRYSKYIKKITNAQAPIGGFVEVDNFFIDANPIIHECAQKVFNYGNYKRMMDPNKNKSYLEKEFLLFEMFFNRILEYLKVVKTKKLLYIAIDGCAPAGKMMQQRQRRFISASESSASSKDAISSEIFTPSFISVGTEFMENLKNFIYKKIISLFENPKEEYKNLKIIFSPASVAGEGEHKIMEHLRSNTSSAEKETHCMYGPDGDLIMLTLAHKVKKFYLLRPEQDDTFTSSIIEMSAIREEIIKTECINIFDFILLGFLVGNDFLPKIQMFDFLEDGMDTMFKIYKETLSSERGKGGQTLTDADRNINFPLFKKFIGNLSKLEERYLRAQALKEISEKSYENYISNDMMNSCVSVKNFNGNTKTNSVTVKNFDYVKYKELYNSKITKTSSPCVKDYLQTLDWVFKYYAKECVSFKFFYPHYYAPLMTTFFEEFPTTISFDYPPEDLIPHEPFKQLLAILPPQSSYLLPKELRFLTDKKTSPLKDMYPDKFEIDYEGKYKKYQGIALLPMIDYDLLSKVYEEHKQLVKGNSRNKKGKNKTFVYSEKLKRYKVEDFILKSFVEIK